MVAPAGHMDDGLACLFAAAFLLSLPLQLLSAPRDTVAPFGTIRRPAQFAVLNSNAVRLEAEAGDRESGVACVEFHVTYSDANRMSPREELIAVDSTPPFEATWDCSRVLDQGWLDMMFFCWVQDRAGNRFRTSLRHVLLDRNGSYSPLAAVAPPTGRAPVIDGIRGRRESWPVKPAVTLTNDDNTHRFFCMWDRQNLYCFFEVTDSKVFTRHGRSANAGAEWDSVSVANSAQTPYVWEDDCVALFLDTRWNRSEYPDADNRYLYIAPTGRFLARQIAVDRAMIINWGKAVRCSTVISTGDVSGYAIEAAIPWSSLDMSPRKGLRLGLDLYFVDREEMDGPRLIASWSCKPHNHLNSSEWGTLVLEKPRASAWIPVLGALLVAGMAGFAAKTALDARRRRHRTLAVPAASGPAPGEAAVQKEYTGLVGEAVRYLQANFADPDLDRAKVAAASRVSPGYLSQNFQKATGCSLSAFLNEIRLRKAAELLRLGQRNVTEAALDCGYNSLDHFIRQFRQYYGITPKRFQQKAAGKG